MVEVRSSPDPAWYADLRILGARPLEFFPTARQSSSERLNAMVRLILYCTVVVFATNADVRYVLLGVVGVALVSVAHKVHGPSWRGESYAGTKPTSVARAPERCTRPTRANPFANPTLGEFLRDPNRPPACKYEDVEDEIWSNFDKGQLKNLGDVFEVETGRRQFGMVPSKGFAPDTVAFRQFLYGSQGVRCRESTAACAPDKSFIRF